MYHEHVEISNFDRVSRIIGTSLSVLRATSVTVNSSSALRGQPLVYTRTSREKYRVIRAFINDVPKIRTGKNQNQNWALIGRGSKTPRLLYLIFWKTLSSQTYFQEYQNQRKECSPDRRLSECYTPEARAQQLSTTGARRQTSPPHHTHNFCLYGPRQRSHGEGEPLPLPAGGGDRSNECC